MDNMNARVGKERVKSRQTFSFSLFSCIRGFKYIHTNIQQHCLDSFSIKTMKKEKVNEKHIYNILITTELITGILWPIYIIHFVKKTDPFVIPSTNPFAFCVAWFSTKRMTGNFFAFIIAYKITKFNAVLLRFPRDFSLAALPVPELKKK